MKEEVSLEKRQLDYQGSLEDLQAAAEAYLEVRPCGGSKLAKADERLSEMIQKARSANSRLDKTKRRLERKN